MPKPSATTTLLKYLRLARVYTSFSARKLFYRRDRKRLFIDCGSNLGQGFAFFSGLFPEPYFDYVMVEPNPHCLKHLRRKYGERANLDIVAAAAWTQEGTTKFFGLLEEGGRGALAEGGSIVTDHNSSRYEASQDQATEVRTIDFCEFVKSKEDYDEIVIKMDIESSEYDVLDKMIRDEAFGRVKHIFVEFHSQYMKSEQRAVYRERERRLTAQLRPLTDLHIWH